MDRGSVLRRAGRRCGPRCAASTAASLPKAGCGRWEKRMAELAGVRRNAVDDALLDACLAHQADAPLREIAKATVQQPAAAAAGAEGEVAAVDEAGFEAPESRVARHSRADDPSPDDEDVEDPITERGKVFSPGAGRLAHGVCLRDSSSISPSSFSWERTISAFGRGGLAVRRALTVSTSTPTPRPLYHACPCTAVPAIAKFLSCSPKRA